MVDRHNNAYRTWYAQYAPIYLTQQNSESFSVSLLCDKWIYHTFTGFLDCNIQAVTY